MELSPVSSFTNTSDGLNSDFALNFQDYLKLLVTEISNQDPLNPVDNKEFITQLATYSQLNMMDVISKSLNDLSARVSRQESISMLGKEVEVEAQSGSNLIGEIISVNTSSSIPSFTVRTSDGEFLSNINMSSIKLVR